MKKTATKKDKRTRLQKSFHQVVLKLYRKKNLDEITINEVCEKVDVPRSSFYYHYETIRDVLVEIENDFLKELVVALKTVVKGSEDKKERFKAMLDASYPVIKAHEQVVKSVTITREDSEFIKRWVNAFNEIISSKNQDNLEDFVLSQTAINAIKDFLGLGLPFEKLNADLVYEGGLRVYEIKKAIAGDIEFKTY